MLSWLALSLRADERAKLLASKIIGLEEKVLTPIVSDPNTCVTFRL